MAPSVVSCSRNCTNAVTGTRRLLPIHTLRSAPRPTSSYVLVRPTPSQAAASSTRSSARLELRNSAAAGPEPSCPAATSKALLGTAAAISFACRALTSSSVVCRDALAMQMARFAASDAELSSHMRLPSQPAVVTGTGGWLRSAAETARTAAPTPCSLAGLDATTTSAGNRRTRVPLAVSRYIGGGHRIGSLADCAKWSVPQTSPERAMSDGALSSFPIELPVRLHFSVAHKKKPAHAHAFGEIRRRPEARPRCGAERKRLAVRTSSATSLLRVIVRLDLSLRCHAVCQLSRRLFTEW